MNYPLNLVGFMIALSGTGFSPFVIYIAVMTCVASFILLFVKFELTRIYGRLLLCVNFVCMYVCLYMYVYRNRPILAAT